MKITGLTSNGAEVTLAPRYDLRDVEVGVADLNSHVRVRREGDELPNVSIRVVPLAAGPHRAFHGSFVILDFPQETPARAPEPTTIYSEHPTGALYLDKPREIETYARIWADLDRVALDHAGSSRLISQRAKEWSS